MFFKISLFLVYGMTPQPIRRPGHNLSTNKGWAWCLDDGDWSQKSGLIWSLGSWRVWLWAWCGYKANSRIRSLCLLFMRVSGAPPWSYGPFWKLTGSEELSSSRWGRHNEPGSSSLTLTRLRVTHGLHSVLWLMINNVDRDRKGFRMRHKINSWKLVQNTLADTGT